MDSLCVLQAQAFVLEVCLCGRSVFLKFSFVITEELLIPRKLELEEILIIK